MLMQIRKLYQIYNVLKQLTISYDSNTNTYTLKSDANLIVQSDQNIAFVSNKDTFIVSKNLHLNPPIQQIQKQPCLKELHGN